MKTEVKSTRQLKGLFPELPNTDKFKRKLDEFFTYGFVFNISSADRWKCYIHSSGRHYKNIISYKGKSYYFRRTKIINSCTTLESVNNNPDRYRNISTNISGRIKVGEEEWANQYNCEVEDTQITSWAELCKFIGLLVKEELVHVHNCWKCNGTGVIPQFMHYGNGICFECMGIGKWYEVTESTK